MSRTRAHALAPLHDQLAAVAEARRPFGDFEALDWSAALVQDMLNVALFGGALPAGLLSRFLRPLHRGLPAHRADPAVPRQPHPGRRRPRGHGRDHAAPARPAPHARSLAKAALRTDGGEQRAARLRKPRTRPGPGCRSIARAARWRRRAARGPSGRLGRGLGGGRPLRRAGRWRLPARVPCQYSRIGAGLAFRAVIRPVHGPAEGEGRAAAGARRGLARRREPAAGQRVQVLHRRCHHRHPAAGQAAP